ncbi:peptidase domain-containing ABC transporter [Hyalangium rubrum]|uniref:Peptidase domain-containing ABC transporter n=1 Tax=Hyalangium rubrum TaxID=3103134 RepID=A0ABU5H4M4_9BACT|nr:peptidase domain-containing ABC transporter [Hyalangium sp. s54d21]MDY7228266.1 peptidase domain-containing ABC transporter [Hyalangium sp. s54d21]
MQRQRRVPVILQQANAECGAACLAMILGYYGRKTSIAELRECVGAGRDGIKANVITRVAREMGLRTRAYSGQPEHFAYITLPALIFWEFKHYVVVERWTPQQVDIVDPAIGRRSLTQEQFDAGFTGVVITFEPGVQFSRKSGDSIGTWRTYLQHMLAVPGLRAGLVQIIAASFLLQVLGLTLPIATKVVVDYLLPARIPDLLTILGWGLVITVVMQVVTSYLRAALLLYLQARLDAQMMLGFFEHMLSLPLAFFQQRSTGDLIMRLKSNSIIREVLTNQTLAAVLDGSLVLVYLSVLFLLAPLFGAAVLVIGAVQAAVPVLTARRVNALLQEEITADSASQGYLVEVLTGMVTLKATGAENHALDRWSNLFFNHLNTSLKRNHLAALINVSTSALGLVAPLALLYLGARFVLEGQLSLGTMLALNTLGIAVLRPLSSLVAVVQQLQFGAAHFARLFDVLSAEPEQAARKEASTPRLSGQVELRNVSFRYNPHAPYVLRDISLRIEPGQKIAIVGPTGSGKTTLGLLLLGLHVPTEGEILYDGIPLSDLSYRDVRSQFGVVLQEPSMFSGSIRHNIAFTRPDVPLEEVMRVSRLSAVHDEIMQMPMRYETLISERGTSLSGGQMQRLAIARALLNEPVLLLLDEATSHLDVLTESQIERELARLRCTRMVIAHRLSTVRDADRILVMNAGRIVEQGMHEELLRQGGFYASLISKQLEADQNALPPLESKENDGAWPLLVKTPTLEQGRLCSGNQDSTPKAEDHVEHHQGLEGC